jgi:hypothetical protein
LSPPLPVALASEVARPLLQPAVPTVAPTSNGMAMTTMTCVARFMVRRREATDMPCSFPGVRRRAALCLVRDRDIHVLVPCRDLARKQKGAWPDLFAERPSE